MKLPACIPPPIEFDEGIFALLLSGETTSQRMMFFSEVLLQLQRDGKWLSDFLRVKLNINVSSQVWFIVTADLLEERNR